ncbi:hypothetical protein GGTG_01688 [Gaeumannomyces tritici R3-111a-1]|uniref:Uncharacterized protein n=1 Tax=Gaeumannomyces tritici (strain R3-111a-1) TaxID=644352 RepID=J3NKA8_GAET3|nr:hypothetical protein GGTG_01688 [Gaeumannomyces tritici R3-111a-1]EJT81712.1 hypothetical protein GGTG_01688 [Gaeumannomyces tritici R3-111a-1]
MLLKSFKTGIYIIFQIFIYVYCLILICIRRNNLNKHFFFIYYPNRRFSKLFVIAHLNRKFFLSVLPCMRY